MKNYLKSICFVILGIAFQTCSEDESLNPEKVQFTFNFSTPEAGRTSSTDLPSGTSVMVSIETSTGSPVLTNHVITLLNFGGNYISEPLELSPGNYRVADFMLVNESSEVLFATPKSGSPLASLVTHALPSNFSVAKNKVSNVSMEVLDVAENDPEDFGYAAFNVKIVHPFRLSVFISKGSALSLTSATAYILKDNTTLHTYPIKAKTNLLSLKEDPDETYTLVVIKDGYSRYSRSFNYNDLITELAGGALEIILEPALTMLAYSTSGTLNLFQFTLEGPEGDNITVDWGDGTSDDYTFTENSPEQAHTYAADGDYFVSVTGDIDRVFYFYSFYGQGMMTRINLEHVPELNELRFGLTLAPKVIDLSHNPKLEFLLMPGNDGLENLILPTVNKISFVNIDGTSSLTVASLNDIIQKVYNAAIIDGRDYGSISLDVEWQFPSGVILGPPSPWAINLLNNLRDYHGWTIEPNP